MSPDKELVALPVRLRSVLEHAAGFAKERSLELYAVGGLVRDRLLGEPVADLDLVWLGAGDPAEVSVAFGKRLARPVSYHPEFLTSSCEVEGFRVDLGRARVETYSEPAALPTVRPGTLDEDLRRRDFSVNAMACPVEAALAPGKGVFALIDPCGGRSDLEAGRLRVLHGGSFIDDPTRILRGLELTIRHDFEFAEETRELAIASVRAGYFALLSGARVRHELERLFSEATSFLAAAEGLRAFALDRALDPGFQVDAAGLERVRRFGELGLVHGASGAGQPPAWLVVLVLLAWDHPQGIRRALAGRIHLGRGQRELLTRSPTRVRRAMDGLTAVHWSAMDGVRQCARLSAVELGLLDLMIGPTVRDRMAELRERLSVSLRIGGADLRAAGAPAGPGIREALEGTLAARRMGEVDADRELDFALDWLGKVGGDEDSG